MFAARSAIRSSLDATLAFVFSTAGASKLLDPEVTQLALRNGLDGLGLDAFVHDVAASRYVVAALGAAECALALWIVFGPRRQAARTAIACVLLIFTGWLAAMVIFGSVSSCGCGTPMDGQPLTGLARNAALLAAVGVAAWIDAQQHHQPPPVLMRSTP